MYGLINTNASNSFHHVNLCCVILREALYRKILHLIAFSISFSIPDVSQFMKQKSCK